MTTETLKIKQIIKSLENIIFFCNDKNTIKNLKRNVLKQLEELIKTNDK